MGEPDATLLYPEAFIFFEKLLPKPKPGASVQGLGEISGEGALAL